MNLIEAVKEMNILSTPSLEEVSKALNEDFHVIVGDLNNYGDVMLKYDFFIEDGVLYSAKVSDSTRDTIVLTLESAALYSEDYLKSLWDSYLSGKDRFYVDTLGYMHEADIHPSPHDMKVIKRQLQKKQVLFFTDSDFPPQGIDVKKTSIYVVNTKDKQFIGIEALKTTIDGIPGAAITNDQNAADIIILILPNDAKAPHKNFFEWLSDESTKIPVVANALKEVDNPCTDKADKVLLFWTSNAFMVGLFSPKDAAFKASMELSDAINQLHKGD